MKVDIVYPDMTSENYTDVVLKLNDNIKRKNNRSVFFRMIFFLTNFIFFFAYIVIILLIWIVITHLVTGTGTAGFIKGIVFAFLVPLFLLMFFNKVYKITRLGILDIIGVGDYEESITFNRYVYRKRKDKLAYNRLEYYKKCDKLRHVKILDVALSCDDNNSCKVEISYIKDENGRPLVMKFNMPYRQREGIPDPVIDLDRRCVIFPSASL